MIIFDIIFEARIFEYGSYLSRVESHILRMGVDGFSSLFLRDMIAASEKGSCPVAPDALQIWPMDFY
jgi:hypothetical protein